MLSLASLDLGSDPPVAGTVGGRTEGPGTGVGGITGAEEITGARGMTGAWRIGGTMGILDSSKEFRVPRLALDTVAVGMEGGITGLATSCFG